MRPSPGKVVVIALEHEEEMEDSVLLGMADWSAADLERMGRFAHRGSKTSWCVCRKLLDDALRDCAGIVGAHHRLEAGGMGKPSLPGSGISFNWSHSRGFAALALAVDREIGVDAEGVGSPRSGYIEIAESFFREEEREWVGTLPCEAAWRRFVSVFVQKEAWLKMTGMGLGLPLSEAPAALSLPPRRGRGRILLEIGRERPRFLAVDASGGEGSCEIVVREARA